MVRKVALAAFAAIAAVAALQPGARAADVDWVPNSAGLIPLPVLAEDEVAFIHPTRRLVAQRTLPGRFLLGHALFGLYQGGGAGWATLTPNCFSLVRHAFEDLSGMLGGCGVEGIAPDPLDPLTMYVSTYNIDILAPGIPVTYGGVYRSTTGGLLWRKLLGGVRGNAIAVRRASGGTATIVVGRIQKNLSDVGTDDNASCRAAGNCSPSVYVSSDGGSSWRPRAFEGSPCANGNVFTSSRLVGNLAFDPVNGDVVYAGANSGLWVSTDAGETWTNELIACGSSPGFAATEGRAGGARRLYVGTYDGLLRVATTNANGPGAFTTIADLPGQILSVVLDRRDPSERTLYVASWTQPGQTGGGEGGVFEVVDRGDGSADVKRLSRSLLEPVAPLVEDLPSPYPLVQDPRWRPSLFLAQHPLAPDLLYASTVLGGVWTRAQEIGR